MKYPKENMHYSCIACTTIDFVMRMENKNYLQVIQESAIQNKENKDDQIYKH